MAFKMKGFSGFKGKVRQMKLARKYELEDREQAKEDSYVRSGFTQTKASIINQYASGIGNAMAEFGSEGQKKWKEKKDAKK